MEISIDKYFTKYNAIFNYYTGKKIRMTNIITPDC